MTPIYLASASPRRSQLLTQIGVAHRICPVDIDESRSGQESPAEYVIRLAATKAQTLWARLPVTDRLPVLGSDTTVALGHEIFGKPSDRDDGIAMLQRLAGNTHQVLTAVALVSVSGCALRLSTSDVTFGPISAEECALYWATGEPQDKAGGYAVQGAAAAFITRINGSYSGIMGLPLAETVQLLQPLGWTLATASNVTVAKTTNSND